MVATCGGVFFGVAIWVALTAAAVWLIAFFTLRYASVASILAGLALPIAAVAYGYPASVIVFAAAAAATILFLHRGNLKRLRAGTENRFTFGRARHAEARARPWPARRPLARAGRACGRLVRHGRERHRPARHRHLPPGPRDRRGAFRRARHVRGAGEPGRRRRNLDGRLVGRPGPDPDPAVRPGALLGLAVRRHLVRPPAELDGGLCRHRRRGRRLPEHRSCSWSGPGSTAATRSISSYFFGLGRRRRGLRRGGSGEIDTGAIICHRRARQADERDVEARCRPE